MEQLFCFQRGAYTLLPPAFLALFVELFVAVPVVAGSVALKASATLLLFRLLTESLGRYLTMTQVRVR